MKQPTTYVYCREHIRVDAKNSIEIMYGIYSTHYLSFRDNKLYLSYWNCCSQYIELE